jgi:hypothetical protein
MEKSRAQNKKREYAQFLEEGSMPSNQSTKSPLVSPELDRLCARCRAIDLKAIFQKEIKVDERGSFIMDLQASIEELKASACDMCQLFGSVGPSDFNEDGSARTEQCHLRAFSANRVFAGLAATEMREIHDTTLLGVVRVDRSDARSGRKSSKRLIREGLKETGYLCSPQAKQGKSILKVRRLSLQSFDLNLITDCLAYCLASHHGPCSAIGGPSTEFMRLLRVIDCHTAHYHSCSGRVPIRSALVRLGLSYVAKNRH